MNSDFFLNGGGTDDEESHGGGEDEEALYEERKRGGEKGDKEALQARETQEAQEEDGSTHRAGQPLPAQMPLRQKAQEER